MQVRVFEAPDMASGLKLVKQELGPDALILSTRTVRNGKLGILGKPMLEITAAVDAEPPQPDAPAKGPKPRQSPSAASTSFRQVVDEPVDHLLGRPEQQPAKAQPVAPVARELAPTTSALQDEVNELKNLVKNLAGQITQLSEKERATQPERIPSLQLREVPPPSRVTAGQLQGDHLLSMLIERGINVETSRTIAGFLRQSLTEQELSDPGVVTAALVGAVENLIEVQPPQFSAGPQQHRLALVGPTGVGKTTTLAKIAASYLGSRSASVALITIDTYRIAAVEQLKVYGEIMRLPVEVVISPEQLARALDKHRDKELVLIDTAGRSPRDSLCIEELASFLPPELEIAKHLVLSAATREQELLDTIARFSPLGITNTIFTKVDECSSLGILLNVQIHNPHPLSYVTNGQRVPEDLLEISPKIVAELIISNNPGAVHG